MEKKRCVVLFEEMSTEDISAIQQSQLNIRKYNNRRGSETAFAKALRGSKIFLKAQGYIKDEAEELYATAIIKGQNYQYVS